MHRSKHPITIRMAPKTELTPDHDVILPGAVVAVDRTGGTFGEVLRWPRIRYRCTSTAVGVRSIRCRSGASVGRLPIKILNRRPIESLAVPAAAYGKGAPQRPYRERDPYPAAWDGQQRNGFCRRDANR